MSDRITAFLREHIAAGDFPSASYLVAEKGVVVLSDAVGRAVVEPESIDALPETIYDLASLTKPLVTGLLIAMMIENGVITADHHLATVLGEFEVRGKRGITILDLLTHTSHLPAWRPLYLSAKSPSEIIAKIAASELDVGSDAVIYSDLNFITLAAIAERFGGARLDELAAERLFAPLGLKDTFFNPPSDLRGRIAASEKGSEYERAMCREDFPDLSLHSAALRTNVIWGEVHDNNAFFMDGVAGHAGLFATAGDVFTLARQFLPGDSELLRPETCELFRSNFTRGLNEDRSFAFQLASSADSTAGPALSGDSFGHNGFTGTSLWVDPGTERIYVLLTNRTHGRQAPFANINAVRRRFHELAVEELG